MEGYPSYAAPSGKEAPFDAAYGYASPTPTPSPRGHSYYYPPASTPQRPATRAHFRNASTAFEYSSPRPSVFSPRFNSDGQYATDTGSPNVSGTRTKRKQSFSNSRPSAHAHYRYFDRYEPSNEDQYFVRDGIHYVILSRANHDRLYAREDENNRPSRHTRSKSNHHNAPGRGTDHWRYEQTPSRRQQDDYEAMREKFEAPPRQEPEPARRSHSRRMSSSVPQRPQTARPSSSHKKEKASSARRASKLDEEPIRIPAGYSVKNWDTNEEPILLLGSVFDANNLGKWIYDWTVYVHGSQTPISYMSGDLWLLLINLAGNIKRAEDVHPRVRAAEKKELIRDFIKSGYRLMGKLRKLLKACEQPMLDAAAEGRRKTGSRKDAALGKNAGVEFVETLFGRERELAKTEHFMQSVRTWKMRFDVNCEEILADPTM